MISTRTLSGTRTRLSALWLFVTLNYLYCDVITLMDPTLLKAFLAGNVGGMNVSQGFLLAAGVLVEIPMAMVFLSRVLDGRAARWTNVVAAGLMTLMQAASLLAKAPAPYYLFFSAIEIACTAAILWYATMRWERDGRASH
jgi:hypothetical protein